MGCSEVCCATTQVDWKQGVSRPARTLALHLCFPTKELAQFFHNSPESDAPHLLRLLVASHHPNQSFASGNFVLISPRCGKRAGFIPLYVWQSLSKPTGEHISMTVHGLNGLVDRERGRNIRLGRFYYLNHILYHVVYIANERESYKSLMSGPISCWS